MLAVIKRAAVRTQASRRGSRPATSTACRTLRRRNQIEGDARREGAAAQQQDINRFVHPGVLGNT